MAKPNIREALVRKAKAYAKYSAKAPKARAGKITVSDLMES